MADLRDGLLRAIAARIDAGYGMALVISGEPWRCCPAARDNGPAACTCRRPIYDLDQTPPTPRTVAALALGQLEPDVRHRMCGDCAYRPNSPEKTSDETVAGDPELLERLAATGTRFWCHDGMRTPTAWHHPAGIQIPAAGTDSDYKPLIVDGVPYRADGQPGLVCAGWAARRRALTARAPAGKACGTGYGHQLHLDAGETPCARCAEAFAELAAAGVVQQVSP